ncbi:PAS domain-containing protein [Selenomonadales bacterium OttesenSCG-928-I06]|nr:PAS domain-containing protein [Selenomonadales bacterium OttesenSCG-928-I06]
MLFLNNFFTTNIIIAFLLIIILILVTTHIYFYYNRKQSYKSIFLDENDTQFIYCYSYTTKNPLVYISPSISKFTGYTLKELNVPTLFNILIHPEDTPRILELRQILKDDHSYFENIIAYRIKTKNNDIIWVEQLSIPIFSKDNILTGFYGIVRKVTNKEVFLKNISNIDRLSLIGQMASSVAHEIRNPVTTVRGYLQVFAAKNEFIQYKDQFSLLINELDRACQIITEYLSLNNSEISTYKSCQLNSIIESMAPLLQAYAISIGKSIEIKLTDIPETLLDENQIRQLILNIVRNGLESMTSSSDRFSVNISTYLENEKIVLKIQDQGTGIPKHILDNLGKPFLTTKKHGTGLGLAVCYKIVHSHNANIEITSNQEGTLVSIKF